MTHCELSIIEEDRVLLVTLNRSPGNDLTPQMLAGVGAAVRQLHDDSQLDLLIIRGEGASFSKGYDVDQILSHETVDAHRRELLLGNDVCTQLAESTKPTVAAINGHCLGGGLELALSCHFRLGVERARFALPELSQGLLPGLGGIHRLVELVGRAQALEMIVAGVMLKADEALTAGLLHRVLPRDQFWEGVLSFVRGMLAVDQPVLREAIRLTAFAEGRSHADCVTETIESILRLNQRRMK